MSINLDVFLVTYDRLYDKVVDRLSLDERGHLKCYCVQKGVSKDITSLVPKRLNEWELPWNNYDLQTKQYYEYSAMVHLYNNQDIIENTTHVGILHYDVLFRENSINDIITELNKNPETVFYQMIRPKEQLSLLRHEFNNLCNIMCKGMEIEIDCDNIWERGWISECLSVTPKHVMLKFAKFLNDYRDNIEYILKNNVWNIMNHCPHRLCGIVERLWGIYLMSLNLPLQQLNILHDWDSYQHHHMSMNGTGLTTI